jgi:hypothetical protein
MKLKAKLMVALLAVALLPLIGAMVVTLANNSEATHRIYVDLVESQVQASAERLNAYFEKRKRELSIYASAPLIQSMDFLAMQDYLKSELERHSGTYEKFIVGRDNGYFHNTSGGNADVEMLRTFNDKDPQAKPKSISKRDYWQYTVRDNAQAEKRVYVSEPMISYTTGVRQLVISASIVDSEGQVRA